MIGRKRKITLSYPIIGYSIIFIFIFGCKPEIKKEQSINQQTHELAKDINTLLPTDDFVLLDEDLLKEIPIKNNFEWFDYFSLFKADGFRHYESNSFVRFSKNRKYRLVYDLIKKENKIYDEQWKLLATFKVEANNPEFYIITFPLEHEAGIILFDGIQGISKYGIDKSQDYKIRFHEFYPRLSNIFSEKNQFEILETCNEVAHGGIRKLYSFDDGALIDSIVEDCGQLYNGYLDDLNLVVRGTRDSIRIYSEKNDKVSFYLPHRYHPESFKIFEEEESYTIGTVLADSLIFYVIDKAQLTFNTYTHTYRQNQYSTTPFAFNNIIGYSNFSISTLDDGTQKLTDTSISFYHTNTNNSYKLKLSNNEGILSCTVKQEQLICMDLSKVYSLPISQLEAQLK